MQMRGCEDASGRPRIVAGPRETAQCAEILLCRSRAHWTHLLGILGRQSANRRRDEIDQSAYLAWDIEYFKNMGLSIL